MTRSYLRAKGSSQGDHLLKCGFPPRPVYAFLIELVNSLSLLHCISFLGAKRMDENHPTHIHTFFLMFYLPCKQVAKTNKD